jgi:tripartite-type tricarboxylate transporter receptor subunit TctC
MATNLMRPLLALLLVLFCNLALAQAPRPVRILVGFPPGGGTDAIARAVADRLKDELGVPVVVENRPGAGGQIAAQTLKASPPDGTTFFISHDHTISILPLVLKNPGFDPAQDFVPVAGFATFVNGLAVSGGTPARSYAEFLAWVKGRGGKATIGIPAPASVPEFLVKVIGERNKLDIVAAAYRGGAPLMADMLGNQIPAGVGSVPDFIEYHRACAWWRSSAPHARPRCPMCPPSPSWVSAASKTCRSTASSRRRVPRRR